MPSMGWTRQALQPFWAKVFLRILQWVVYFIKCAGLIGVILENVVGIRTRREGRESVMDVFERALNKWCPEFCWRVDQLALVDYMCPQSRVRVFLRGMRRCIASPCPPCLKPFGSRFLRSALGKFGHTPRSSLCENQQQNLICMEAKIRQQVLDGKLQLEDVVVVSVDRGQGLTYPQHISVNVAPTFTTSNSSLFVLSVRGVVDKTPDDQREFFRKFRNSERLALQGFPPDIVFQLSPELAMFAAGNAYPVPLIIATLHPMLHALSLSKVNLASWPPAELLLPGLPDCLDKFTKDSLKKPRLLKGASGPVKKRARSKSAEDSD
jgi:site-specific DNA-cytosine methylase